MQGTWGWPEPRRGGRQVSDRRGPSPSRAKFYCNRTDEEASWRSTLLCTARNLKGKKKKNPGFTPGPRRISRAGGGRGSRGAPGLCVAAPHSYPLPSSPLCAPTLVLCCGCRRRIKSALGLGSPRGSSSSWSETLQAVLNMYTMQRAGRGAGAASPAPLLASHRLLRGFVPGEDAGLMTCLYWIDKAVQISWRPAPRECGACRGSCAHWPQGQIKAPAPVPQWCPRLPTQPPLPPQPGWC